MRRSPVPAFLVGCLVGVLVALAVLLFRPKFPTSAVGFAVCGQLIGVVVIYSDGSAVAMAPLEATEADSEAVLGDLERVPAARRALFQLSLTCGDRT